MSGADWRDDPALRDLDAELRAKVGGDWRRDAEDAERLAAAGELRRRRLSDVAEQAMSRGDRVQAGGDGWSITGEVVHASEDLVCLDSRFGAVDVNLSGYVYLHVVDRARSGGHDRAPGAADTFRARLSEHELSGGTVEVCSPLLSGPLVGTVGAVARDHLLLIDRDGGEWHLPLTAVVYVLQRSPGA